MSKYLRKSNLIKLNPKQFAKQFIADAEVVGKKRRRRRKSKTFNRTNVLTGQTSDYGQAKSFSSSAMTYEGLYGGGYVQTNVRGTIPLSTMVAKKPPKKKGKR